MSKWLNDLIVRIVDDSGPRPIMELTQGLHYWSDTIGAVIVPAGFVFDGASIPQAAMSMTGWPGVRAACVHDWMLEQPAYTRATADDVFREALAVCAVPEPVAQVMWAAVALRTARLDAYPPDEERVTA
jgi:hypothetical protein